MMAHGKSKDRARKRKKRPKPGTLANNILSASHERIVKPRDEEEELLRSVDLGDIPTVRRILAANPHINVNCTDILGRTPIRLAVENEQTEIVELLIEKTDPRYLYESMLLAITLDHDEIALAILRHPIYEMMEARGEIDQFQNSDESLFAAETTPLILAAQRNRYEVVSVLLQKGQTIAHPHAQSCDCPKCLARTSVDELRFARDRLNAYRGLASEAYICLSASDPILTAFERSRTLKQTAHKEKHYKDEYEELAHKLSDFVVKLMNNVRGNEELNVILNEQDDQKEDDAFHGIHGTLARLKLALKYNEKGFVAHASVQKKLSTIWYGDFQPYALKLPHRLRWFAHFLLVFSLPLITLAYWLSHSEKIRRFLNIPYVKFMGQTLSFLIFLTIIFIYSILSRPTTETVETIGELVNASLTDRDRHILDNPSEYGLSFDVASVVVRTKNPSTLTIIMFVFVLGLIGQECLQLYASGVIDHFDLFNIIDFISLNLYNMSFGLISITYYEVKEGIAYFKQEGSFQKFVQNDLEARERFYWVTADRAFWNWSDPTNICEGVFAVANVLSFTRLLYILAANDQLGPLQVSIRRMMADVSRFFVIFFIVFIAFMVGLNNMYWYYDPDTRDMVQSPASAEREANAGEAFGTLEKTLTTVFWACFGMGDSDVVELNDYDSGFTSRIGYIVYGAYNTATVIVLFNMLIAMMTRSFESIQNDESQEWKFARAQLYMDILQDSSFVPVPLNVIPSPISIYQACKRLVLLVPVCYRKCRDCCAYCDFWRRQWTAANQKLNRRHHRPQPEGDSVSNLDRQATTNPAFTNPAFVRNGLPDGQDMVDGALCSDEEAVAKSMQSGRLSLTGEDLLRYEIVMKRVVKRYIFESQKVETSQLEGDIEELKQDLSSFKYEVINAISTQKSTLNDSLNMVSAKLDMYSALQGASMEQIHETNARLNQMRKLSERDARVLPGRQLSSKPQFSASTKVKVRRRSKSKKDKGTRDKRQPTEPGPSSSRTMQTVQVKKPSEPVSRDADDESESSSVEEEEIVADIVIYGHTPGRMQPLTERPGSHTCSDASADTFSDDGSHGSSSNEESDLTFSKTGSDATSNDGSYICSACAHRQSGCHKPTYKPTYTRRELNHFISLLNGESAREPLTTPTIEITVETPPSPPCPPSPPTTSQSTNLLQVHYTPRMESDTEYLSSNSSDLDSLPVNSNVNCNIITDELMVEGENLPHSSNINCSIAADGVNVEEEENVIFCVRL